MVATSAFGIGIDYPNVWDVTLFGLPYSKNIVSSVDELVAMESLLFNKRKEECKLKHLKGQEGLALQAVMEYDLLMKSFSYHLTKSLRLVKQYT